MKDEAGTFKGVRAAAGAGIPRNGSDERPEDGTPRWKDHEPAMQILDEIIDAHGGMDLWNSIDELDVVLSNQGFLFTSLMRWRAPVVKRKQVRLLTRDPDYAVDIVSRRVRGAHFCEYKTFDGLAAPTRRRGLPLLIDDAPLPEPTLVAIDIHSIEWRARCTSRRSASLAAPR